jgi:hypothetical protein
MTAENVTVIPACSKRGSIPARSRGNPCGYAYGCPIKTFGHDGCVADARPQVHSDMTAENVTVIPACSKRGSIPARSRGNPCGYAYGCPIKTFGHDGCVADARPQVHSGMTAENVTVIPACSKRGSIPARSRGNPCGYAYGCPIKTLGHDGCVADARPQVHSDMTTGCEPSSPRVVSGDPYLPEVEAIPVVMRMDAR